jgi:hypothetical protein
MQELKNNKFLPGQGIITIIPFPEEKGMIYFNTFSIDSNIWSIYVKNRQTTISGSEIFRELIKIKVL